VLEQQGAMGLLKNSYERHCDPPQAEKQSQRLLRYF
jgi:hypothetical protein